MVGSASIKSNTVQSPNFLTRLLRGRGLVGWGDGGGGRGSIYIFPCQSIHNIINIIFMVLDVNTYFIYYMQIKPIEILIRCDLYYNIHIPYKYKH